MVVGLLTAVAGGLLYLLSLAFLATPPLSAAILLGGRALLGVAESFVITGGVSWGLAVAGPANTGRVIAWVGMAMFAALAAGAPIGTTLYALGGFTAPPAGTVNAKVSVVTAEGDLGFTGDSMQLNGVTLSNSFVRLLPKDSNQRTKIAYSDIAALTFSGRDTAAGKSWEAWMKKYAAKKAAGETNIALEPEPLD